jgi:hypothetical protein
VLQRLAVLNQVVVVLGWSLPLNLGLLETLWFVGHLRRERPTEEADQPAHRVRSELAAAHLAFGVLGLLAVRFRGMFWFATVIGQAVFLGGVTAVNARMLLKDKMVLFDALMSLAHVGLLMAYDPLDDARPFGAKGRR